MKTFRLSLIFIFGLISCHTKSNKNAEFIGYWLLASSYGAQCNVCPEVLFTDSSSGVVTKPSKELYNFKYKIKGDVIVFTFKENQKYSDLSSEFRYHIKTEGELKYLILESLTNNGEFILVSET